MLTSRKVLIYLSAGLASGILSWAGARVLPEASLFLNLYPGMVLGVALLVVGQVLGEIPRSRLWVAALLLPAFSMLGWRVAVDVGFQYSAHIPYVAAGAMGAFCVAVGLLFAWRIQNNALRLVSIVSAAGALGGLVFQLIEKSIDGSADYWGLILFVQWQTMLMLGIALAVARVRPALRA